MREEENLYKGTTVVLERPEDLIALPPDILRAIPRVVRDVFVRYPSSFRALAAESELAPLARWLRKMAKAGRCELAINHPGPPVAAIHPAPEVFLQVGAGAVPVLLSGGLRRVPKRCPEPLAEVLRRVGVVRLQYGAAGGLLHPSEQRSLPSMLEELERNTSLDGPGALAPSDEEALHRAVYASLVAAHVITTSFEEYTRSARAADEAMVVEVRQTPMPAASKTYWTFYEDGCGGYLATNRHGATWKFPMTGGDSVAGPPLDSWLREFFDRGPFEDAT